MLCAKKEGRRIRSISEANPGPAALREGGLLRCKLCKNNAVFEAAISTSLKDIAPKPRHNKYHLSRPTSGLCKSREVLWQL
jgi:hypothetical protein